MSVEHCYSVATDHADPDDGARATARGHDGIAADTGQNVPIVVILGTKRSLATALTGKSYLQLNFLHRMMGRAIWVSLTIHAVLSVPSGRPC